MCSSSLLGGLKIRRWCILRRVIIGLVFFGFCLYAQAFNNFVVKNIQINGLQRIEVGTVYSYLPIKVGDTLTAGSADDIIKKLYASGFFKDVRLGERNQALIIDVIERPIISNMSITGDHVFDHDKLVKALNDNGLISGRVFDQSILDTAILSLKSEYYNRGLYSVIISAQVIALKRNRVAVNIAISEGLVAKIAGIEFVGNDTFSSYKLQNQMFLTTGSLMSWWYKDNQYSNDKLVSDVDKIKAFYMNQGYINFKLLSIQVQLSSDKKSVYITINIAEGKQYHLKEISLADNIKVIESSSIKELITLKPGDIINQDVLNKDIENIKTKLSDVGYAFATVNPIPTVDENNKVVSYILFIELGSKVYVRAINITGNDKTRDIVIRREMRQSEASLYSSSKIKRSKDRINLLGYFENVDVKPEAIPGTNQVDVNVKVKEKTTNSVHGSIGYAQGQGLLVTAGISYANLFGSGKSLSLNATTSKISQGANLSFTDPFFKQNGSSLGYDIYYNKYMPYNLVGGSPYSTQTIGFKLRNAVPVSEFDKINFGLGIEKVGVDLIGADVPFRFIQFYQQYGSEVYDLPASVGWVKTTTDSALWPTRGAIFSQVVDGTLPVTGPLYYRFTSNDTWFLPVSEDFTWKTSGMIGFINSYGTGMVPFYQNYYMGGITSLRGYYMNNLGPNDTDGSSLGGTRELTLSNDLLFPLPGFKDNHTVRMSLFFDMGTLWGGDSFAVTPRQEFRASYGVSLTWFSPLAPLKISYGIPLFSQPNDIKEPFQFMLGASF